jgi:hypothetical protein
MTIHLEEHCTPPILYIKDYTNDKAGNPVKSESNSKPIPKEIQSAVMAMLPDLPNRIELGWRR